MSKAKIERLKKKFWNEYTLLWDVYPDAFELMREIGFEQGKLKKGEQLTNHSPQDNLNYSSEDTILKGMQNALEDVKKGDYHVLTKGEPIEDTRKGCEICNGRGMVKNISELYVPCPACSGAGE